MLEEYWKAEGKSEQEKVAHAVAALQKRHSAWAKGKAHLARAVTQVVANQKKYGSVKDKPRPGAKRKVGLHSNGRRLPFCAPRLAPGHPPA